MNPYHRAHSWMASTQMPWYTSKSLAVQKMSGILQVLSVKETHALLNIAYYIHFATQIANMECSR